MEKIYIGKHQKTAQLKEIKIGSRQEFYDTHFKSPPPGKKGGPYFTTASEIEITPGNPKKTGDNKNKDGLRRNNKSHKASWGLCIDGDKASGFEGCIPFEDIHKCMEQLGYNYILYTSASHDPTKEYYRWRLTVFCEIKSKNINGAHKHVVKHVYDLLHKNGCENLTIANESLKLSNAWYFPIESEHYQSAYRFDGKDFQMPDSDFDDEINAQHKSTKERTKPRKTKKNKSSSTNYNNIEQNCGFIKNCKENSKTVSEPEWYAMMSIVARCENGHDICHQLSKPYPNYSPRETDAKIEHALEDTGPYLCKSIAEINPTHCKKCELNGKITSPINLGTDAIFAPEITQVVDEVNQDYAGVWVGSKYYILKQNTKHGLDGSAIKLMSFNDMNMFFANKKVRVGRKEVTYAQAWLQHPKRKQYEGIIFEPSKPPSETSSHYNLWQGFALEPKKGDWSLFKKFIFDIIADGKPERAKWIIAWVARIFQDPGGERPGTSIAMRGRMGVGKGVFANNIGKLLGSHYLQIANSAHILGRFNSHLATSVVIFLDEGFWAGDKQAEGILKNIITEPMLTIEQKHKDVYYVKNNVNLIIASNNSWVVPSGLEERRFFVTDVSDAKMQNHAYFKAINQQMDNGGYEAMLYDLLEMDISDVNLRTFECTEALLDQKINSMSTIEKYWFQRLTDGNLCEKDEKGVWGGEGNRSGEIRTDEQHQDYLNFCKIINDKYVAPKIQFGRELNQICKGIKVAKTKGEDRKNSKIFPGLKECRRQFEERIKHKIPWDVEEHEGEKPRF